MSTSFATPEGLRTLLTRLHDLDSVGHWSWRHDREAARLMEFTIRKYRWLARNHHCEPEDSAYAAFEAMRTNAVRFAADPWAVVTIAVQTSLIAEERAAGLLCAPGQARRREVSRHHDARRFCEYETEDGGFHPLLHIPAPPTDQDEEPEAGAPSGRKPTTAAEAADRTIKLFVSLGWPENTATCAVDFICARLVECKDRAATHSLLRRDERSRALLDLDRKAWAVILRLVLGHPDPDEAHTWAGRGLLVLFACGYTHAELLSDLALVRQIREAAPRKARRSDV